MAELISVGELARGAGVSAASLAAFITKNFDYEQREAALLDDRILVKADESPDMLAAFQEPTPEAQAAAVKAAKAMWANRRKATIVESMPHTSTPSFEGYRITRYGGFVTGTSTINTVGGLFFSKESTVEAAVNNARIVAIHNLKQRCFDLGCNAVVGLDVDFVNVDSHGALNSQSDSHYIVVCANGTAVEIEPLG